MATLLLGIHAVLLVVAAWHNSPNWDEVAHLASGIHQWNTGETNLYRVNPPLVRLVATFPFLNNGFRYNPGAHRPPGSRQEFFAGKDFFEFEDDAHSICLVARLFCIPFALTGAFVCYRWAAVLYSPVCGLIALSLWVFSPTILGNGATITPDVPTATVGILHYYRVWIWLQKPAWTNATICGVLFGVCLIVKTTWIISFLIVPLLFILSRGAGSRRLPGLKRGISQLLLQMAIAVLVVNVTYAFSGSFRALGDYRFTSGVLSGNLVDQENSVLRYGNRFRDTWMAGWPVPLPADFVMGIDIQKRDFEVGKPSYLRGQWSTDGWYYYYLYAAAVKVPPGTWAIGLLSLAFLFSRLFSRKKTGQGIGLSEAILMLPAIAIVALVSSQTALNHHFRYVIPAMPFLFVLVSRVGLFAGRKNPLAMWVVGAALAWNGLSLARAYPYPVTYFNESIGSLANGHKHLIHSNLDWGQGLYGLRHWYETHRDARPFFLAYSLPLIEPRTVGIEYQVPPSSAQIEQLVPGWYAVSASSLHRSDGRFQYFEDLVPSRIVANSIFIYQLTAADMERLIAENARSANQ